MTGMSISGKMSVGVRTTTTGVRSRISRAITTKVYGRRSAKATIHISFDLVRRELNPFIARPRRALVQKKIDASGCTPDLILLPYQASGGTLKTHTVLYAAGS